MKISFVNLHFDLFSISAWEIRQIRNNVVCPVAHLILVFCCALTMGCFSTYFCKLKEIRVLQPIFPDCYFMWLWLKILIYFLFLYNTNFSIFFFVSPEHLGCTPFLHELQLIQLIWVSFLFLVTFTGDRILG